jgi:hypothetical protein
MSKLSELVARLLKIANNVHPNLDRVISFVAERGGVKYNPKEAWEALATEGLIPEEAVNSSRRSYKSGRGSTTKQPSDLLSVITYASQFQNILETEALALELRQRVSTFLRSPGFRFGPVKKFVWVAYPKPLNSALYGIYKGMEVAVSKSYVGSTPRGQEILRLLFKNLRNDDEFINPAEITVMAGVWDELVEADCVFYAGSKGRPKPMTLDNNPFHPLVSMLELGCSAVSFASSSQILLCATSVTKLPAILVNQRSAEDVFGYINETKDILIETLKSQGFRDGERYDSPELVFYSGDIDPEAANLNANNGIWGLSASARDSGLTPESADAVRVRRCSVETYYSPLKGFYWTLLKSDKLTGYVKKVKITNRDSLISKFEDTLSWMRQVTEYNSREV